MKEQLLIMKFPKLPKKFPILSQNYDSNTGKINVWSLINLITVVFTCCFIMISTTVTIKQLSFD